MTDADLVPFGKLLLELGAAFGREIDESTVKAFTSALEDLPLDLVEKAARRHLREGQFFPRPSELRLRRPPVRRSTLRLEDHRPRSVTSMREKFHQLAADLAAKLDPTKPAPGDAVAPEDPEALDARRALLRDQFNMLRAKGGQG